MKTYSQKNKLFSNPILSTNYFDFDAKSHITPRIQQVGIGAQIFELGEVTFWYLFIFSGRLPGCLPDKMNRRQRRNAFSAKAREVKIVTHMPKVRHIFTLRKVKNVLLHLKDDALITQTKFSSAGERHTEIKQCETFKEASKLASFVSVFIEHILIFCTVSVGPYYFEDKVLLLDLFDAAYQYEGLIIE